MEQGCQLCCFQRAVVLESAVALELVGSVGHSVVAVLAAAFAAPRPLLRLAAAVVVEAKQRTGEGSSSQQCCWRGRAGQSHPRQR